MEWRSIEVLPPKKKECLYLVAIVTEKGFKRVATALCEYDKKRDKFFWEIQHTFYDISRGLIVAWAELPPFPKEVLNNETLS